MLSDSERRAQHVDKILSRATARPKPHSMRNIRRMDDASRGTHGWMVQVQRQKRITMKMFSDGLWGGKSKALVAARAWRDQQTEPLDEYAHELWQRNILRRNNRSGLVGVARYERRPQPNGRIEGQAFWLASWTDENGASRKRKFSVKRWGERGARQQAIETREREVRRAVAARTVGAI